MSRQIKITADTAELRKSISDISKMVSQDLGKSKIELFTPETKKFLKNEALAYADALKSKIDKIKESTRDHQKALAGVVSGSKEELALRMKILRASQHIMDTEKERKQILESTNKLQGNSFSKQFMKYSGLGAMKSGADSLREMGPLGVLGAGLGAGGLAALAYGGSRLYAARSTWKSGVDDRLKLMGRGEFDLEPHNRQGLAEAGLNAQSARALRLSALDVFGRGGAGESSIIQRGRFERGYGIESGTMTGIGAALRPNLGGAGANAAVMKLEASLIASGIKDAIGPYLETAASMLTELNEKGLTMDDSVLALFSQMTKTGMGEGRVKSLAMGMDQSIRGSTGESNAFYQSVFNRAGIGGGSIGGAQAAMRMGGLFGTDLSKYHMSGADKRMFHGLGIGGTDYMQKVASSTLGQMDKMFSGQTGPENRLSRFRYMMGAGMAKDEGQAAEVEEMLRKVATGSGKERASAIKRLNEIKDENRDPNLAELKKINASNAGIHSVLENIEKSQMDLLGDKISPAMNEVNKFLREIDDGIIKAVDIITDFAKIFGYTSQKDVDQQIEKGGANAKDQLLKTGYLNQQQMKDLNALPLKDQTDLYRQIKEKAANEQSKNFFVRNPVYQQIMDNPEALKSGRDRVTWEDRKRAKGQSEDVDKLMLQEQRKAHETQKQMLNKLSETARNTRNSGPVNSASTTGQ